MSLVLRGLDEYENYLDKIETLPEKVERDMLTAMAKVVQKSVMETSKVMLREGPSQGKYIVPETGVTQSIRLGKIKRNRQNSLYTDIIFYGKQHGVRLATIAFINEYGAVHFAGRYQYPRPFIRTAVDRSSAEASDAAAEIFNKFINQT